MARLNELFAVRYGDSLELNRLERVKSRDGVPFVSRSERNNGIAAYVKRIPNLEPNPAGELTCALSGSVMAAFVQRRPYYTAFHVACLRPVRTMTLAQKIYYCACIRMNRYRYGYGRQANRTLKELVVPGFNELPAWLDDPAMQPDGIAKAVAAQLTAMPVTSGPTQLPSDKRLTVSGLFSIKYGHSYELCNLERDPNGINFVSRRTGNNGVSAKVARTKDEPSPAGSISVALGGEGGACEAYLQPAPFYSGRDVAVLQPRNPMSLECKLFYCLAIKANHFRYGFGRQANRTLATLRMPLPPKWVHENSADKIKAALAQEIRAALVDD